MKESRFADAAGVYRKMLDRLPLGYPGWAEATLGLARALEKSGDIRGARVAYQRLADESPGYRKLAQESLKALGD